MSGPVDYDEACRRAKLRLCRECGRKLGPRAIFLYLVSSGHEVRVCSRRCLDHYNESD